MDTIDYQIVELLAQGGRTPLAQVAAQIGKSTATVHQRVKRLLERGYVNSFRVDLNWEALGYPLDAFVSIRDNESKGLEPLASELGTIPYIVSAKAVTGEFDLLLHVRARSSSHPRRDTSNRPGAEPHPGDAVNIHRGQDSTTPCGMIRIIPPHDLGSCCHRGCHCHPRRIDGEPG